MEKKHIGLWGDSIGRGVILDGNTRRYHISAENPCAVLEREMGYTVSNYAHMAHTVKDGLAGMTPERMNRGDIAFIEYGSNDCDMDWRAVSRSPELIHSPRLSLNEFKSTLQSMVERCHFNGMQPMLITPLPIVPEWYFKWVSRNLNSKNILRYIGNIDRMYRWQERYANAVVNVATRTNARILDLRDAFLAEPHVEQLMCVDGIHPNDRGYRLIADVICSELA